MKNKINEGYYVALCMPRATILRTSWAQVRMAILDCYDVAGLHMSTAAMKRYEKEFEVRVADEKDYARVMSHRAHNLV